MTLLAAYNFDEASGSVIDVTGNGHDFALTGNTVRTTSGGADPTGYTGKGLTQSTSSVDAGPAPFGLTASRTIMMWIKSAASVTDGRIFETVASSDGNSIWEFPLLRDSSWHLQAWNASTFGRATLTRPTDGNWHHITGTYDGTNLRVYKDGVLSATTAFSGPLRADSSGTTLNFFHTAPDHILRHVRVYSEALDATAITTLMNTPVTAATGVSGTLAGSLPTMTGTVTAAAKVTASLAGSLGAIIGSVTGSVRVTGSVTGTLGSITFTGTGQVRTTGTIAGTLPAIQATVTGTVGSGISGQLAGTLPALQGNLTASAEVDGQITGVLPALQGSITAAATAAGQIAGQLAAITASFTGNIRTTGTLAGTMHALVAALTGTVGEPAPYDPVTDPVATIRSNLATATPRDNPATAVIRANTAEAAP